MKRTVDNQRGAFLVIFAICLMVLLAFLALAIEGGRWYLVRAELSKSVDAAALAGANNISNPYVDPRVVAQDFGYENFQAGYVGTPGSGAGTINFVATSVDTDKISVSGNVTAMSVLAQMFGVSSVPVAATGIGQKKKVEIMMILDRSGSMSGSKIISLRSSANSFLSFFEDTQDKDKVGLISFAATIKYEWDMGNNYYNSTNTAKINGLTASGGTNMESALNAANDGWTDSDGTAHVGFSDQTGVPGDQRISQFVVFFSDGQPTCFTGRFRYRGADFNAVACSTDNCQPGETSAIWRNLNKTDPGCEGRQSCYYYDNTNGPTYTEPLPTGDGSTTLSSLTGYFCDVTGNLWQTQSTCNRYTTRWYLFDTRPVSGYTSTYTNIPESRFNGYNGYTCTTARDLATQHAQELKNKYIKIYVIGLGSSSEVDEAYLRSLSSGTGFTYIAPTAADLQAIFNKVAKDIKLRLSQ
jgi:hypothetical protein